MDKVLRKETDKRGRKGGKERHSDPPWKKTERETAKWFQIYDGVDEDSIFSKLKSSTGRLGHLFSLGFDAISKHYFIEVKHRKWSKEIWNMWVQINQISIEHKVRNPVLVLSFSNETQKYFICENKKYETPEMHIITPDRHKELLEKERLYDEANTNGQD